MLLWLICTADKQKPSEFNQNPKILQGAIAIQNVDGLTQGLKKVKFERIKVWQLHCILTRCNLCAPHPWCIFNYIVLITCQDIESWIMCLQDNSSIDQSIAYLVSATYSLQGKCKFNQLPWRQLHIYSVPPMYLEGVYLEGCNEYKKDCLHAMQRFFIRIELEDSLRILFAVSLPDVVKAWSWLFKWTGRCKVD